MKPVSSDRVAKGQVAVDGGEREAKPKGTAQPQKPETKERKSDYGSQFAGGRAGEIPKAFTNPEYRSSGVASPLMLAARNGDAEQLRQLLRQGADPALQDEHGNTALFHAAREGEATAVRILAQHDKTLLSHRNQHGETAAAVAAKGGKEHALMTLIDQGADLYQLNDHRNLLEHAVLSGDRATVRSLVVEIKRRNLSCLFPESAKSSFWQEMIFNAADLSIKNISSADMSRVLIENGVGDISLFQKQRLMESARHHGNDEVIGVLARQFPILRHL